MYSPHKSVTMKALVKHLIKEHLDRIVDQSLLDCHVLGLHSIMLLDSPEQRIRLFYADHDHQLWKNQLDDLTTKMSVAAHGHHCNVTLLGNTGHILNYTIRSTPNGSLRLNEFKYVSQISNGQGRFKPTGNTKCFSGKRELVSRDDSLYLGSDTIHTVWVRKGETASWFVLEGKENPTPPTLTYSNASLENFDWEQLYNKPTRGEVIHILEKAELL